LANRMDAFGPYIAFPPGAPVNQWEELNHSPRWSSLFLWKDGAFAFYEGFDLPSDAVTIAVDLPNLIMEGARRIQEWEECLQLLPDSGAVFRVIARPESDKITLSADEWKVLFLINGQRTLEELCRDSAEDPLTVYRVVYGLSANKLIEQLEEHVARIHGPGARPGTVSS